MRSDVEHVHDCPQDHDYTMPAPPSPRFVRCALCERALSAHWVGKHRAKMGGRPVCNCCRASDVPVHPATYQWDPPRQVVPSGEPVSGSIWSDPFIDERNRHHC